MKQDQTQNISISVPRNWFILLVVGVLVIAGILAYQFVLAPATDRAAAEVAKAKAEQRRQQDINDAARTVRKTLDKYSKTQFAGMGKLTLGQMLVGSIELYKADIQGIEKGLNNGTVTERKAFSMRMTIPPKGAMQEYKEHPGPKLILAQELNIPDFGEMHVVFLMIKQGDKWKISWSELPR